MLPVWPGFRCGQRRRRGVLANASGRLRAGRRFPRKWQRRSPRARRGTRARASREKAVVDLAELVEHELGAEVIRQKRERLASSQRAIRLDEPAPGRRFALEDIRRARKYSSEPEHALALRRRKRLLAGHAAS